jgi:DNA end-binding protein Ku
MGARAIWKAILKVGSQESPVKLYSAVQDKAVHLHVLDRSAEKPIKQHMVNPESGEEVPKAEVQKGYEIERGRFVLVSEQEIEKIQPKESRTIELTRFVPTAKIDQQWYDRPYYLGPDNGSATSYFALAEALNVRTEKE